MKFSMKRLAALALALVMVLGLLPVVNNSVNAADVAGTLTDETIGLSYVTSGSPYVPSSIWTADANTLTGSVRGTLKGSYYFKAVNTLTITNTRTSDVTLSFDYVVSAPNGGTVTIDDQEVTSGSISKELAAESGSVTIELTADRIKADNTVSISITNLRMVNAGGGIIATTFEAPAYGSYIVAWGETTNTLTPGSESVVAENTSDVQYTLTVDYNEDDYKFVGWYNVTVDKYVSTNESCTLQFDTASTIKAVVVPKSTAVFLVGSNYFDDLDDAVTYAENNSLTQITLVSSGSIGEGSYTIPAGITLLIPMDTAYTTTPVDDKGTIAPEYTTAVETPEAYLTLTLADGVELIVNGAIDLEAKHTTLQGGGNVRPYGGRVSGAYGAIYMSPESNITLNDGATLYAFGYVYGDGTVTANSGAKVYEYMQVTDFPGGTNLSGFADTDSEYDADGDGNPANDYVKIFPFQQYYVQNIEVALTLYAGATEYIFTTVTAGAQNVSAPPIEFIGTNGMFVPASGYIVKDYDPSTDRLIVDVNGDASMNGIALDMSDHQFGEAMQGAIGTTKFDSSAYILCLNSNISININSGTTTIGQDLALLPGVEISVAKDATLVVSGQSFEEDETNSLTVYGSGGHNIYVYDLENWGKYVFSNAYLMPATYSPTSGRHVRTADDLKDVVIDINGTVICDGFIYSTVTMDEDLWVPVSGGAAIVSTGKTGQIVMNNGAGTEEFAYRLDGASQEDLATIASAWLQNGDGTFLETAGAEAGATFDYCAQHDQWYTGECADCANATPATVDVTWIIDGVPSTQEVAYNSVPQFAGGTPTKAQNGCTTYTFAGWSTTANGEVLSELPAATAEAAYYAIFTEGTSHVGDTNQNHICDNDDCKAELSSCNDSNQDHVCDYLGCLKDTSSCIDSDQDHLCDYAGCQDKMSDCSDGDDKDHNCDYVGCGAENVDGGHHGGTAYCNAKPVCAECGEEYGSVNSANHAGTDTYYGNKTDDTHTVYYSCCDAEKVTEAHSYVNGVCDCEAVQKLTVTWIVGGNSTTETYEYGATPSFKGSTDKAQEGCTTYTFNGWDSELVAVTANVTYTATYTEGVSHIDIVDDPAVASGCESTGLTAGSHCGACSTVIVKQETVSATGHSYGEDGVCTHLPCNQVAPVALPGSFNNWDTTVAMTWTEGGIYTYSMYLAAGEYTFKINENGVWLGNNGTIVDTTTDTSAIGWEMTDAGDCTLVASGGTYTFSYNYSTNMLVITAELDHIHDWSAEFDWNDIYTACTATVSCDCGDSYETGCTITAEYGSVLNFTATTPDGKHSDTVSVEPFDTNAIYLYNAAGWDTVNAYFFTNSQDVGSAWPGIQMDKVGDNLYAIVIPAGAENVVFNDGTNQTSDLALPTNHTNVYDNVNSNWGYVAPVSYTLFVYDLDGSILLNAQVPYGTSVYDYVKDLVGNPRRVETEDQIGYNVFTGWVDTSMNPIDEDYTMPAENLVVISEFAFTGWIKYGYIDGWVYEVKDQIQKTGWTEIDGSWYYLDPETGIRAEGVTRVPYPKNPINGITYAPNDEDIAYEGENFIDKDSGLFYFGEDGTFQSDYTDAVIDENGAHWCINGLIEWHPGMVEDQGSYFYFIGDRTNGGNILATGDVYVTRNNSDFNANIGGVYTFGTDGALREYKGIIKMADGTLRYYKDAQMMIGIGLTQVGENYIHVNSYGQLIVDAEYWVPENDFGIEKGIYYFDENGFIVIPEPDPVKNGFYYEDGEWFYYVDGMKGYCAGLISTNGILWYETADAEGVEIQGWVYVKSNGALVSDSAYYVTNVNGHETIEAGDKCVFGADCLMQEAKNGIIDGYYYVNNSIAYNAGVVEIEDGKYIYVKSNGEVVVGRSYWITNVGDSGIIAGLYMFDENGVMLNPETEVKEGIVDGYYYVDGHIAYCAGLIEIEPGKYIYVKSNGQLATGEYWTTNHNGVLTEGLYDFGEDGILVIE